MLFFFFFDAESLLKACRWNDRSPNLQKSIAIAANRRGRTVAGWICASWEPPVPDADPKVGRAARNLENDMFKKHYASSSFSMQNLWWKLVVETIEVPICKTLSNCCKIIEEWPLKTTVRCVRTPGSWSRIPKSVKLRATSRTTFFLLLLFLLFRCRTIAESLSLKWSKSLQKPSHLQPINRWVTSLRAAEEPPVLWASPSRSCARSMSVLARSLFALRKSLPWQWMTEGP